jgi:hypothetical protein
MGFFANLKAKREANKAQAAYDLKLYEWTQDHDALTKSLDIFTGAAKGDEPEDNQLVQKAGELVLWSGSAVFHEAGRTPSRYVGSSQGFSIPIVAGVRYRVGSTRGTLIPGEEMQMEKEQGLVKLTNQRLIFAGSANAAEWQFAKFLSAGTNPARNDYIFAVSNRKKTSGLRFSNEDGIAFGRLFALALYSYEKGIPATIKAIKDEIKEVEGNKPKLVLPPAKSKEIEA